MNTRISNNDGAQSGASPRIGSVKWIDIGDGGVKAEHDEGDETGAIVTTARVVQGGNGKWTPAVYQLAKGRPKKTGYGRIGGKTVSHYYPGQVKTREEAIQFCESKWRELISQNGEFRRTDPPLKP